MSQRRQLVLDLVSDYRVSLRRACCVSLLSPSVWYYQAHRRDDGPLRMRIKNIAQTCVRYGIDRVVVLLKREGWKDNHKRIYRIYKEEGLNLRSKRPKRNRETHIVWSAPIALVYTKCGAWILWQMLCSMARKYVA